jgi:hypothetical protein
MDCKTARRQLGLYLDKAMALGERAAIEAHLAKCRRCADQLAQMTEMVSALVPQSGIPVPEQLWSSIENGLDQADEHRSRRLPWRILRRPPAMAASIMFVVGVGVLAASWIGGSSEAAAAPLDFSVLLDALPLDADRAFQKFLTRYGARRVSVMQAREQSAGLSFDLPESLPGGFDLKQVFVLRFGGSPGVAARYSRDGELLAAIFHPPVEREHYGTHKDNACVIGQHRGHAVAVGTWKLVHLTDPTTCHCVLSQLDEATELPAVMRLLAPGSFSGDGGHPAANQSHDHAHGG